ncbi:MAG: alpha/beta hydrolase family protein [Rubripirellula sp.]
MNWSSVLQLIFAMSCSFSLIANAQDSLPSLNSTPKTVEELWANYDPRSEPLDVKVVRQWEDQGLTLSYVTFSIGSFRGEEATMAAFFGYPKGGANLPAVMHMHGGGQRAFLQVVKRYAERGYATLSINWGGREMENAATGDPNTNWGAVDPTQNNVGGYSNLLPGPKTIDTFPSARNNNWFLLTVAARRGITFLERQAMVDPNRIGIFGHSMGGRLTGLVAGTDHRVRAASPSVGGSGYLQTDLWGLPGSARRVNGDLTLFANTIAGQAYLQRITCPILYLSATNDFNAPMDFVEKGMDLIPHENKRTTYAQHLNHRFTPSTEVSRPLWFDSQLQQRFQFPRSPNGVLSLDEETGIPVYRVFPDAALPVKRVEIYYGYDRDPRNRFWADAEAREIQNFWEGQCPIFDLDEPLFVFSNVYYELAENQRRAGDPEEFVLSVATAAYPDQLRKSKVKATERTRLVIDDFSRSSNDWYTLNISNRHHWLMATRKLADPRWDAPRDALLEFEVYTTGKDDTLTVELKTDTWRNYTGRKAETWTALIPLENQGRNLIALSHDDFQNLSGQVLDDWFGITELILQPGSKSQLPITKGMPPWSGEVPVFSNLRWTGGKVTQRPKPYLRIKAD